jgi:UDP-GlcNAc:undecaprenyl-phosphate/decaprenyl-phosphate GlcNAc-1-phosphate transferase
MVGIYILVLAVSFLIAVLTTPAVIRTVIRYKLMDYSDGERKIHTKRRPTMGGIAIFLSLTIVTTVSMIIWEFAFPWILIPGLAIMFVTGFKDDQLHISAARKFLIQFVVASGVILLGDLSVTSFMGLFGIYALAPWLSFPITLVAFVGVINAYNLIDGIDGLAAGIGILAATFFGIWHGLQGEIGLAILAFSLVGALAGFLVYNFSPAKIFMGDTGSLVVGFVLATLAISAIFDTAPTSGLIPSYFLTNSINLTLAVLLVPVYDTLRVFALRLARGTSPFTAGRDHVHHVLLGVGLTHVGVSLLLYLVTIVSLALAITLVYHRMDATLIFVSLILASVLMLPTVGIKRRLLRKLGLYPFQAATAPNSSDTMAKTG